MFVVLFVLSCIGGLFAGLLGVGGAVVLIPLLLLAPPLLGAEPFSMHEVAGITMIQVLAASLTACIAHKKAGFGHNKTILSIGLPLGFCALGGALLSHYMDSRWMLLLFAILVLIAFLLLLQKGRGEDGADQTSFTFRPWASALVGGLVGSISGIIGAGGGFILIPVMVRILGIPMRVAVGSSLGIIFIGAVMGSIGKLATLQVSYAAVIPVILGSVPASLIGARLSRAISPRSLRYIMLLLILLILVKTWHEVWLAFMPLEAAASLP